MAAACTLAVAATLTPLGDCAHAQARATSRAQQTGQPRGRVQQGEARQARWTTPLDASGSCDASLRPTSGTTDGAAVRRIKDRGRLIVGVDQNSYLWGFRDPASGTFAGFDIDIVHAIAQDILGDPDAVQFLTVPTDQRIPAIQEHKVDMVVRTMTINCDRTRQVAFSTAYFTAGQQILVANGSTVSGFDDSLEHRTVCTADGSTGETKLRQDPHGATVLTVDNQLDCLVRLQLGLADAVFTDNALAAGQAAQDPSVRLVGQPVTQEPYGVAMNLGDSDLVRRVNSVLEAYRSGGTDSPWMRSYRHWLQADLPGIDGPPPPAYR
ncbi:glutamate ABC transporter substrate-binding protein [Streptomyces sp. V4-01]|uniref:Glutamate ABC transporter substrate-binding protein n=2 Tax=Actinacidiphila polyblastidii TaxID=3110430 RepID=A0ABU7P897_9ACTN|nr:glutamate ABC transporter substrate-binding protein [Streptomyces sp. V4-01]